MILLAWGSSNDDIFIPVILVVFLLMVIGGQWLARYIFRRFFNREHQLNSEQSEGIGGSESQ